MKNRVYKYIFNEFIRYFIIVLFALTATIWTIQAVNLLDLVTDDGHAFGIYFFYSFLSIPKIATKLIPFTFLIASIITILKLEKDNELILLWTAGLNKIHIVNLMFRISLLIMFFQLIMSSIINPETLNFSRSLIKNSELQFVPSLLKERTFNDTVKGLTVFVDKKNPNGVYENIFIRDEGNNLTNFSNSGSSSTIFAKKGYVKKNEKKLILVDGNIQKLEKDNTVNIIKFEKTEINLSGLSTRTTSEIKIQETSSFDILRCVQKKYEISHNCNRSESFLKDLKIEINKRFGSPFFIPLVSLISSFLLYSRKDKKINSYFKYIYFLIGFLILVSAEIVVRYSGISLIHTVSFYLIPIAFIPLIYLFLIRTFKYENLN